MDEIRTPNVDGLWRCGLPIRHLKGWLAQRGHERLRIATYGISSYEYLGHYVPPNIQLELLVGVSGIDPLLVSDLSRAPVGERWQRLMEQSTSDQRSHVLRVLRRAAGWQRAGATVRIAPPGRDGGLMHLKLYLGHSSALVGSANFTLKGLTGADQNELLIEVSGPSRTELDHWWASVWASAWPIDDSSNEPDVLAVTKRASIAGGYSKENNMSGPQTLLGHWLGKWGAWALNGNGVVAYPHQLQAVEWIRPDGRAYLLGDEVGLGKTYTAALLWMRHQQLYGEKARLIYVTKPSLIIDAISAFVDVLGVDELLQTTSSSVPQRANDLLANFSIFHRGTFCWDMVADERGQKRNKDFQIAVLLKEGRYRIRPDAFLKGKLEWLAARAASKLHEQINIPAVARLLDSVYTFVSIDTLRNPQNPLTNVFDKMAQSSLVPLLIVDESHGLGRTTQRRSAIADLIWGPRDYVGKPPILRSPGALVVFMTGTPVHPNESETASRLGLLDFDADRTPHNKHSYYDDVRAPATRDMLESVKERAVIRRKDGITLDGKPHGLPIFPKRLVFPFQKWIGTAESGFGGGPPEALTRTSQDVLMAIDQYVAREASHGAKLVSLIRGILRTARDWPEIKQLVRESEANKGEGSDIPLGVKVVSFAKRQIDATTGVDQNRWRSLQMALEAARIYEEKLKDPRLENLTWKFGQDDNHNKEKQMLFTKVGWVATAYDSLAKGTNKNDQPELSSGDMPDEDEETAGELVGSFDSVDEMLESAGTAIRLANEYLDPTLLNDGSKVRFSMLVALLEGMASLKLWPKRYESMPDEDRFGWGIEETDGDRLRDSLARERSELNLRHPWVVHARYIHSVVDTAVRLQLRYGREVGKPVVGIIIGDTPNHKRDEIKDAFSKGKLDIVCMSDAGAEGINLQRSNRIVLLDVPVSPGRIEQIAGRVHRLGSTHAAQVTLLLPPGHFGTRVFAALRKAASSVFRMAAGRVPARPESGAENDPYYVRQLADYEARLLAAVAETSGVIRGAENRDALQQVVNQPELDGQPNTDPIAPLFKNGFELMEAQRKRFADENVATQSALMPEVTDLVDALVKFDNATTAESPSMYRVPVEIVNDRTRYKEYGDLVTRERSFRILEMKDGKRYWYGAQRFLPTDVPKEDDFKRWLGVIGNSDISNLLGSWRHEGDHTNSGNNLKPETWVSNAIPKGKAIAFCGISNEYKADGSPAASRGEKTLHVMLGFADYASQEQIKWRPFFARGASEPFKTLEKDTWLDSILPVLDERWATMLVRRVTGLDKGYTTSIATVENEEQAERARESAIRERVDEEESTTSWRLNKDNVKTWLDANTPQWWAGGAKLGCRPQFFLMAFGEP